MTTMAIHRLHTRLRVAGGDDHAASRLKRLLREMLDGALELALQRRGLDGRGELCIRRLHAPVRLDLAAADSALVAQWALQIADAVACLRERGDAGLVHYGSRAHALADLALSAPAGDYARAWAWHGLGLWPAEDAAAASVAPALVLRALAANPAQAVAALAGLARQPARFERWWRGVEPAGLEALARAVLHDAGADAALFDTGAAVAPARPLSNAATNVALARGAALPPWLRRAVLARVAERQAVPSARPHETLAPARAGWPASRALALLAIAEAEPALLLARGAALAELLDALATRWAPQAPAQRLPPAGAVDRPASGQACEPAPPPTRRLQRPPVADPAHVPPTEAPTTLRERASAATAFGGLLFLLNLAAELGWPARWLADPVLAARGMRWGLYQLALRLLPPAGRHDPVALAFAGLLPAADPPDADNPPPDTAETTALAGVQDELTAALRARLPQAPDDDAALLSWLCRREGEIRADPGWLELHLSLDDVRTELRVAGLDLDPGWVPWLGLVIGFVYG
jgi:hypothetical protein